jgi:hypothetical protein
MKWKFKKGAKPQGSSDGFWYDLTLGGYINLFEVLEDEAQIKLVAEAVMLLYSLELNMGKKNLLNEF